jgi:hypothetical protein
MIWVIACSGTTDPRPNGGIVIVSGLGQGQGDTILTTFPKPLVVQVYPPPGKSYAHQEVVFSSPATLGYYQMFVAGPKDVYPTALEADTTNAGGQVTVRVTMGTVEGPSHLIITVPAFGFVDTLTWTVAPGHATGLTAEPYDTVMYKGSSFPFRLYDTDNWGNRRPDKVTLTAVSGPVSVSGSTVMANGFGQAKLVASSPIAADTLVVSSIPRGSLAAADDFYALDLFNLDGSQFQKIVPNGVGSVRWSPSGTDIAFNGAGNSLDVTDTLGNVAVIDSLTAYEPVYSRDGAWLYFETASGGIGRIHPNGTGLGTIAVDSQAQYGAPSPSPDGTMIVAVALNSGTLETINVSSGLVTSLNVGASNPQWSPNSNAIAYLEAGTPYGAIGVINADGTGQRTLTSGPCTGFLDWSPDGQWIVARNALSRKLELVSTIAPLLITLDWTGTIGNPSWQPGSFSESVSGAVKRAGGLVVAKTNHPR